MLLFVIENGQISGPSMLPTFNYPRLSGDIVLTESVTSWLPEWIENLDTFPVTWKLKLLAKVPKFEKGEKLRGGQKNGNRGRGFGVQSN